MLEHSSALTTACRDLGARRRLFVPPSLLQEVAIGVRLIIGGGGQPASSLLYRSRLIGLYRTAPSFIEACSHYVIYSTLLWKKLQLRL